MPRRAPQRVGERVGRGEERLQSVAAIRRRHGGRQRQALGTDVELRRPLLDTQLEAWNSAGHMGRFHEEPVCLVGDDWWTLREAEGRRAPEEILRGIQVSNNGVHDGVVRDRHRIERLEGSQWQWRARRESLHRMRLRLCGHLRMASGRRVRLRAHQENRVVPLRLEEELRHQLPSRSNHPER